MIIDLQTCADIFGVATNTVREWAKKKNMPHKINSRNWEIDTVQALAWYLDFKRPPTIVDPTETAEYFDTQYRKYKSQLMQHKSLREKGVLITVDEAEENFTERLIQIRDKLANIPLNWSPYLTGLESNKESQEKLQELLSDLMDELSNLPDKELLGENDSDDVDDEDIDDLSDIEDIK